MQSTVVTRGWSSLMLVMQCNGEACGALCGFPILTHKFFSYLDYVSVELNQLPSQLENLNCLLSAALKSFFMDEPVVPKLPLLWSLKFCGLFRKAWEILQWPLGSAGLWGLSLHSCFVAIQYKTILLFLLKAGEYPMSTELTRPLSEGLLPRCLMLSL